MTTYLYPPTLRNTTRFRDGGDDAMDVESSSEESFISSARSQTLSGTGSPTPGPQIPFLPSAFTSDTSSITGLSMESDGQPIDQITTLLTCGNCSHDVILSGPLLTSKLLLVPSSPVPHILYTNSSPSTVSEESDIHLYLQHANKAIAQLNWEIGRTNAILEMLVLEREKLVALVEQHKALLTPWRRVPSAVLREIFLRCEGGMGASGQGRSDETCVPEVPDSFVPTSGPLLLSQVCQKWRTQALNMPELWSNIRIRIGRGELQESRRLPLIHAWIERSSNHPLNVCMVERSPRSPVYNSDSRNLAVGMLLGAARRWKRFHLVLHSHTPHWGLFANLKGMHLPLLEQCTIITPREEATTEIHPHENLLHILTGAGALKELRLDYNVPILALQFHKQVITHLDLYTITKDRSIPVSMAFETLIHCPNLRSLRVRCHLAGPFTPPSHLYHPNLTSLDLSIDTESGPGAESLLVHFTPPKLTHLALSTPEIDWDQDSIMNFIARCGKMKEFRVKCKHLIKKYLLEILECEKMRGVERLALDLGLGVTNDLLVDLSFPPPPPTPPPPPAAADHNKPSTTTGPPPRIYIPKLKSLEIGGRLFISSDDFLSFVTSRRYPSLPNNSGVQVLEEVVIDCDALVYGFMSSYLVDRLDELRWWGLKVCLRENGRVVYPL